MNSKLKARTGIPNLRKEDGNPNSELTCSDQEKAEVLAEYFCEVFNRQPDGDVPLLGLKTLIKQFENIRINRSVINKHLDGLDVSKSPAEEISVPLEIIFATSLRTKTVPRDWRDGEITALFKKGNRAEPSNYRPVSLTSVVCKIMEKIIRDALMDHMIRNRHLSKQQYGFICGQSTTLQLLTVLEKWTKEIDEGNEIDCIYLDFMKAFDKVPHKHLLSK